MSEHKAESARVSFQIGHRAVFRSTTGMGNSHGGMRCVVTGDHGAELLDIEFENGDVSYASDDELTPLAASPETQK